MGKHCYWRRVGTNGRKAETYQEFTERRFWGKVEKGDGCWLWKAGFRRNERGNDYGQFFFDGKNIPAHRMVLMLSGVILRSEDVVAHHCDNPPCVRPDHLFVTTSQGNTADRYAKGRSASYERNGNAKLSDEQVASLRRWAAKGAGALSLAESFGISRTHVWRLVTGKMRKSP